MYRGLIFQWLKPLSREPLLYTFKMKNMSEIRYEKHCRHLSLSSFYCKKRKSSEEKAVENKGRRIIKYFKSSRDVIGIWHGMTIQDIANALEKDIDHIFKTLEFADKNQEIEMYKKDTVIHNIQIVRDIAKICGHRIKYIPKPGSDEIIEENRDAISQPPAEPEYLQPRPPVVCVMGHVDHGKTTLLDALRNTSVVDQEFGGITQHIGAFEVRLQSGHKVTFLDTPGHAAFASMRARGAFATDIVVLVVAADDGVMEQTVESVRMARQAGVPILVAINKIDKPGVNIERAMRSLAEHGIVCEAIGGDVQAVPISALKRMNLETLVEALIVEAQLMDLKADPGGLVEGVVIEAQMDSKIGKQATVLVQRGTLKRGDVIVAGLGWAKVRSLTSSDGVQVSEAIPSTPVSVHGWRELPSAGDQVLEVSSEKRANEVLRWRQIQKMKEKQESDSEVIKVKEAEHREQYLAKLKHKRQLGRFRLKPEGPRKKELLDDSHPALYIIVKGDVDGSVEAILDILETYDEQHRVKLELTHFGVGPITPNDLEIAELFNATIYAFNVDCAPQLAVEAKTKNIPIKRFNVIYKMVDDVKQEITNRIPVRQEEELVGEANVLAQFLVSEGRKKVPVAGSRCVKGSLVRSALYKVVRGDQIIYQGKLASMKHLKDEVSTIKCDQECGLRFEDPSLEVTQGDTIICYKMVDVKDSTGWDPGF